MKRLLYLSYASPLAPFSGYAYRTLGVLRWLVERFRVDVIFQGHPADLAQSFLPLRHFNQVECVPHLPSQLAKLKALAGAAPYHHALFSSAEMRGAVSAMVGRQRYDLIWLNKSVHFPILETLNFNTPVVIDQIAAEPSVWDNLIRSDPRWYVRWYSRWNKSKVLGYERRVYRRVAGVIAISPSDAAVTREYFPGANVVCVPQGVDTKYYAPDPAQKPDPDVLLFSGTGAVRNVQAMRRLVTEILPLVRQRRPGMRLLWIGNIDRAGHDFLNEPWIETTGFVEHVPPFFQRGRIYVSPFHMGEGMKTKIVEALAMEKVIVGTPIGLSGVDIKEAPFVRMGTTNTELAQAILEFRDRADLVQLGRASRQYVIDHYAWTRVLEPLAPFLADCVRRGAA